MKKLLIGILATLACFACFAGCNKDKGNENESSTPSTEQTASVEDAKKNVKALYQSSIGTGRFDYEVVNAVNVAGVSFSINWTVTCDEGVVTLEKGDVKTKVVVNKELTENKAYTLKAEITAPDGTKAEIEFEGVVEQAPSVVPQAITEAPVVGEDYLLYMYQAQKHQDLYFTGKLDGTGFYLATTNASKGETYADAINVQVEAVEGKANTYYLTFTNTLDTKQYIGVTNTYNNGSWHDNVILAENTTVSTEGDPKTFEFVFKAEHETLIATLDGVKAGKEETTTETKTVSYFLGTSGGYYTFGACPVEEKANSYVGKLVKMVDKSSIQPADKVAAEKSVLSVQDTFTGAVELDLAVKGTIYTDVAINWEVKDGVATIENGKLTIANPTADVNVVIKATLTCENVTETVEFPITVHPSSDITVVTAPVADTAYKMYIYQAKLGKNLYLTGTTDSAKPQFLGTNESNYYAADVYAEVVESGYKFYFKGESNVKSYIYVETYKQEGKNYFSTKISLSTEKSSVFYYNTEFSCWCTNTGDDICFIGTFSTFNTVSASTSYYMTEANMGTEQFPVVLATINKIDEKPAEPENPGQGGEEEGETPVVPADGTAKVTMSDYAAKNNWVNSTLYSQVQVNADITATVAGTPVGTWGQNTGKYYTKNASWRIYQNENGTLTITAAEGKKIVSVKITYTGANNGVLMNGTTQVASDTVVTVNANSITFGVSQTTATDKANGNVQITAIEIIYE